MLLPQSIVSKKQTKVETIPVELCNCKEQGKDIVAQLAGVQYRDQAEPFISMQIYIKKDQLLPLAEGEFYWTDMLQCEVTNTAGEQLGIVESIIETGANDVLVVHQQQGETVYERLIPYSTETVLSLDTVSKKITVDWDADYLVTEKPAK